MTSTPWPRGPPGQTTPWPREPEQSSPPSCTPVSLSAPRDWKGLGVGGRQPKPESLGGGSWVWGCGLRGRTERLGRGGKPLFPLQNSCWLHCFLSSGAVCCHLQSHRFSLCPRPTAMSRGIHSFLFEVDFLLVLTSLVKWESRSSQGIQAGSK